MPPPDLDVAIIGAGFSGLGMAIALQTRTDKTYRVFEKAAGVGGTWRENHYPGCACDVPSHVYSYSFEQNPDWSRMYAGQPEILSYLERCADKYGVRAQISLNTPVKGLAWDPSQAHWRLTTDSGGAVTARTVVIGAGGLHVPSYPDIPGWKDFSGPAFHTAQWRDDVSFQARRVAVVGTGASAIQVVPEVAKVAAALIVFQRTPPWVLPKRDRPMASWERRLFKTAPALQEAFRRWLYALAEMGGMQFVNAPKPGGLGERLARRFLKAQISDPALRARLTPDYRLGCKRVLISNDYYAALNRSNVRLVTDPLAAVTPTGLQTQDGQAHPVDAIIWATGFRPFEVLTGIAVTGQHGARLDQEWAKTGPKSFLGLSAAGYPNLFFLMGPNTGLGHNSMIYMIESQISHVLSALDAMADARVTTIALKPAAQRAFTEEIAARLHRTVWGSGCKSWYITGDGQNYTTWPGYTFEYRRRAKRLDPNAYDLS